MSLNSPEVFVPIITFILGWGSGVITAWAMYRDHDRRLDNAEKIIGSVAQTCQKNQQDIAVLYQRFRDFAAGG